MNRLHIESEEPINIYVRESGEVVISGLDLSVYEIKDWNEDPLIRIDPTLEEMKEYNEITDMVISNLRAGGKLTDQVKMALEAGKWKLSE